MFVALLVLLLLLVVVVEAGVDCVGARAAALLPVLLCAAYSVYGEGARATLLTAAVEGVLLAYVLLLV